MNHYLKHFSHFIYFHFIYIDIGESRFQSEKQNNETMLKSSSNYFNFQMNEK